MALRKLYRSVLKAHSLPTRHGPKKGSTGQPKGPARTVSMAEARRAARILAASQE